MGFAVVVSSSHYDCTSISRWEIPGYVYRRIVCVVDDQKPLFFHVGELSLGGLEVLFEPTNISYLKKSSLYCFVAAGINPENGPKASHSQCLLFHEVVLRIRNALAYSSRWS